MNEISKETMMHFKNALAVVKELSMDFIAIKEAKENPEMILSYAYGVFEANQALKGCIQACINELNPKQDNNPRI
jgi:hypothetical protein